MEYILTFPNTNAAIKAERCMLAGGLHIGVMPLPGEIRAGCGICLRVLPDELDAALRVLAENSVAEAGLYTKNGYEYTEVKDRSGSWSKS